MGLAGGEAFQADGTASAQASGFSRDREKEASREVRVVSEKAQRGR